MSDTYGSRGIGDIYGGGDPSLGEAGEVASAETIKPGYAIYKQNGQFYAAKNSDTRWNGIAALKAGADIDTPYTAADTIQYYPAGQQTLVWIYYLAQSPVANLDEGDKVMVSATDGMAMKWAYSNATEKTDSDTWYIGRVMKAQTGSKTANKMILVDMGAQ